jgi:hypothetical protein
MEEQKAVSEVEGKEVAEVSDEEIATLMAEGKKHQDTENAGDGVKADYILLAKTATKALNPKQKDLYIEGLKIGNFFFGNIRGIRIENGQHSPDARLKNLVHIYTIDIISIQIAEHIV